MITETFIGASIANLLFFGGATLINMWLDARDRKRRAARLAEIEAAWDAEEKEWEEQQKRLELDRAERAAQDAAKKTVTKKAASPARTKKQ